MPICVYWDNTPPSAGGAHETQYRCLSCQTHWLLRTNRWGVPERFRLKPI